MTKSIDVKLLKNNPFNPKNPFQKGEEKLLDESLAKYGKRGCLLVCEDYNEKGKYIVIEGNSRIKRTKGEWLCDVIEGINNDDDLHRVTLDFCTAIKKRNFTALKQLYDLQKDKLSDTYKSIFESIKGNLDNKLNDIKENTLFNKVVILKFETEFAYLKFEQIVGNIKRKIKENDKLWKEIEQIDIESNGDFIQKVCMEILMRINK